MLRPIWGGQSETTPPPETKPELTDEELLEAVAREIVARRLAAPAIFFLESSKPLSFVASQGLVFLGPFVDAAFSIPNYEGFCRLMEDRANVEKLIQRLEALEEERISRPKDKQ